MVTDDYPGDIATIRDTSFNISSNQIYVFELIEAAGHRVLTSSESIGRKNQGNGFFIDAISEERAVPVEMTKLTLRGNNQFSAPILALVGNILSVQGEVEVKLVKNTVYRVGGRLSKEYSAVWLEDESGKVVSKVIEKGIAPAKTADKSNSILDADRDTTVVNFFVSPQGGIGAGIDLEIDDQKYRYLERGHFYSVRLPKGKILIKLSHTDFFKFRSEHFLTVAGEHMHVALSPTIISNSMAVKEKTPDEYVGAPSLY